MKTFSVFRKLIEGVRGREKRRQRERGGREIEREKRKRRSMKVKEIVAIQCLEILSAAIRLIAVEKRNYRFVW